MTIFEWIMLGVTLFGLSIVWQSHRARVDMRGGGLAKLAGVYLGAIVAAAGGILLLIALAI